MTRLRSKQFLCALLVAFMVIHLSVPSALAVPEGSDESDPLESPSVTSVVYEDLTQDRAMTINAAAPWEGEGTPEEPYVIESADQLNEVRHDSSKHFVLGANINLDAPPYNDGEGWEPIANFKGKLDGGGFEIAGLYINRPSEAGVGLFGLLDGGAELNNVRLVDVDVTGEESVGGLAGINNGGSINNSSTSGKVTGSDPDFWSIAVGGLVGFNESGQISHSYSSSDVTAYSAGGLVGDNQGRIIDSYASGNVYGVGEVGGLVSYNIGADGIYNSRATGSVTGEQNVGGLAGYNASQINNSYATGSVSGQNSVGGLVGLLNSGEVVNSYAIGIVTGSSDTGGLIGSVGTGTVTNSYWDMNASGLDRSAAGEGKTTAELQQRDTFADNWTLFRVWEVDKSGGSYPYLRWETNTPAPPDWTGEGRGTSNDPFIITSAEQLNDVRHYPSADYELGGNIDLSLAYGAGGWEPIGTQSSPFIGTLDGRGYTIAGLSVHRPELNEVGLFGVIGHEAELSNIRLTNVDIIGHDLVGGLAGRNEGTITNAYVSGDVAGNDDVGGLVGVNAGEASQSYARSKASGSHRVGGLVGVNRGNVSDAFANGDVHAAVDHAGGLAGSNDGGSIRNAYASGKVTGDGALGGLVSEHTGGNVIASYWDAKSSGQSKSAGSDDVYGKSTAELQRQATYDGWDFSSVWKLDEGESYPYMKADGAGSGLPWTGSGTEEDPYVIKTAAHLDQIRDDRRAHYRLGADIDLDVLPYNAGVGWKPIPYFYGTIDGQGFKIKGLYMEPQIDEDEDNNELVGLFAYTVAGSHLTNMRLEDVNIVAPAHTLVGGLVGSHSGSISYSSVSGTVAGKSNAGGLVGYNFDGNISYSFTSGAVTGDDFLGGLAGVSDGTIVQSWSGSKVEGYVFLGGLVGVNAGDISDSYATGDIGEVDEDSASNGYSGGLVGSIGSFEYGGGTIRNSYSSGRVAGIGYVGGLVAERESGSVVNSYWDKMTSGWSHSAGSPSSYGKTTAEMRQQATYDGWDFDAIWEIDEDGDYPRLQWVGNANLIDITLDEATLSPVFAADTSKYKASVNSTQASVNLTATTVSGGALLKVNGSKAIGGASMTIPLKTGRNVIDLAVTSHDGSKTNVYEIEVTRIGDSSASDQPSTEIIQAPVEMGEIGSATTVLRTPITRITESDGSVRDEVTLTPDQARDTARRVAEAGQSTARIVFPDVEDRVSRIDVVVRQEALQAFVDQSVDLELFTDNIRLLIPERSMDGFGEDLYFRIIPLKEQSQREAAENRARAEQVVREAAKNDNVKVVTRPMTVETNMPLQPVTLVLPLRDVVLPTEEAEQAAFLDELMVFIEHSDGEKRLVKGKIVAYEDGLLGISFDVNKFSTFSILHLADKAVDFHEAYFPGYEDGTFKPGHTVTRAEIAEALARYMGYAEGEGTAAVSFSDVSGSHWAAGAIEYAMRQGLMLGDPTGNFNPDAAITRAEMSVIAARFKRLTFMAEDEVATSFADIDGHWAALEIGASEQAGILNGYTDGTYRPNRLLTRAEAVKVMNRMFGRGPLYEVSAPAFTDVPQSHWAFHEVEEAARDHGYTGREEGGENKRR